MKALFADISEQERRRRKDADAFRSDERRRVSALYDAIQIALAKGDHPCVNRLLFEMHAIVNAAFARRSRFPGRISAMPLAG